eukprot:scaffold4498_cov119-Isochrysis_galbana.AAC.49
MGSNGGAGDLSPGRCWCMMRPSACEWLLPGCQPDARKALSASSRASSAACCTGGSASGSASHQPDRPVPSERKPSLRMSLSLSVDSPVLALRFTHEPFRSYLTVGVECGGAA